MALASASKGSSLRAVGCDDASGKRTVVPDTDMTMFLSTYFILVLRTFRNVYRSELCRRVARIRRGVAPS